MNKNSNAIVGVGFALLATALWSGNFVVARALSDAIHPFQLAFYRWAVATLVFTPFATRSVKRDFADIKKNIGYLTVVAVLGVSIFNTLIYFAGRTTTAVNLSLIALTFPIFILLIAGFVFREKITSSKLVGVIVVLSGVLLIVTKGDLSMLGELSIMPGDPLMLLAAFTFATHSTFLKRKPKGISIVSLQYSTFLIGLLVLFPFFLFAGEIHRPVQFSYPLVGAILYIGVFSSLVSFVSWNKAIDKIGAPSAGMIYFLMPLFSGLVAWLLLDEDLKFYHLISGLLIIIGIFISNRKTKTKPTKVD